MSDKYDNSGVLFKNDKGDNPKRPDYRGSISVVGVDYNISGWIRESKKSGDKFLSLKVEPKTEFKGRGFQRTQATNDQVMKTVKMVTEDNWSDLDEPF